MLDQIWEGLGEVLLHREVQVYSWNLLDGKDKEARRMLYKSQYIFTL